MGYGDLQGGDEGSKGEDSCGIGQVHWLTGRESTVVAGGVPEEEWCYWMAGSDAVLGHAYDPNLSRVPRWPLDKNGPPSAKSPHPL